MQNDLVTYSIPSSVWRQDPPAVQMQPMQSRSDTRTQSNASHLFQASGRHENRAMPLEGVFNADDRTVAWHREEMQNSSNGNRNLEDRTTDYQTDHHNQAPDSSGGPEKAAEHIQIAPKDADAYHQSHGSYSPVHGVSRNSLDAEQHRSDSFYWQSPHSSVHSVKDERGEQSASPTHMETTSNYNQQSGSYIDSTRRDQANMIASTLLAQSTLGVYSASALGSGGPSDWEHFGDYQGEDIDDTELYSRPKFSAEADAAPKSAELPAENLQSIQSKQSNAITLTEQHVVSEIAADCDERIHQGLKGVISKDVVPQAKQEQEAHLGRAASERDKQGYAEENHSAGDQQQSPRSSTEVLKTAWDSSDRESLNVNLDETLRAWSKAGSTEDLIKSNDVEPADAQRPTPIENCNIEHITQDPNVPEQQAISLPAIASHDSVAYDLSNEITMGQQEKVSSKSTLLGGEPNAGTDEPVSERTSARFLALNQTLGGGPIHEDTNGHKPESTDMGFPPKQPTFAPTGVPLSRTQETEDPYAGLDAWGKASLNRYIAMLREESQAETDQEKLNIFTVFANRETRLRVVLYGADNEPVAAQSEVAKNPPIKRASTTTHKRTSKALPALPESATPEFTGHARKPSKKISAAAILGNPKPKLKSLDTNNISSADEGSAVTSSPNSIQYSPGGRPLVARPPKAITSGSKQPVIETTSSATIGDSSTPDGSINFPIPTSTDQPPVEASSAYVPFKFGGGPSEAQNYTANRLSKRQSIFRPYSKMIDADEYHQIFQKDEPGTAHVPPVPTGSDTVPASIEHKDAVQLDLRRFERADFDPLLTVLPEAGDIPPESLRLSELRKVMDAVPDEFSFIHQNVVAWDSKAKKTRESNERERHIRQVESEQRIDALFNDHEIGYGDISELESGFKRSEAARKADEDRAEYQTFVSEVFDVVWTRLHYEIDQLNPSYQEYTRLLDHTTTGKEMFESPHDQLALAPTMDALLTLFQKLEVRHEKAFQAVVERDRRLKKTELSPWYSLGNVAKVKQMERQFEQAERRAILDYCGQRDIRANSLMDHLDQNTLRGVGANQDYMEMVMKAVRRIASGRAFASQPGSSEPGVGLEEVTKAKSVTKALATSSEQIVQTFHVADMLLNAADYELSVAKAKLEGAGPETFRNLKEERAKEDQKLMRDLEHRLALIREDSRRTHDEIVKLLLFLGVQSGHAANSSNAPQATDPRREERLQQALEDAKRRNAAVNHEVITANPS